MNICILKGNAGQDPEIYTFESGGKAARFSLATTERGYTTKDGKEFPERTYFHNIVIRQSGLAGVVEKYVKKGTPILVSGVYGYRDFEDKDGNKRRIYELFCDRLELCGEKKEQEDDDLPPDDDKTPAWLR